MTETTTAGVTRNPAVWIIDKVAVGLVLPLLIDGALLRALPYNPCGIAWIVAATIGFVLMTRRCAIRVRLMVACVYFPLMFALFSYGALTSPFLTFRFKE